MENGKWKIRKTVATSLKHNLTSAYFTAADRLYPKKSRRRIVAYVESYDDVAFWRTLLSEFETDEYYFQVMLPSSTSLAKGKKMVLMNTLNTAELGKSLIACVDSDYDFLLQGKTNVSHKINSSPYIFQTYAYAIENFHCYAESLHEVCVQATLNDRVLIDFPAFLKHYSQAVYPLFYGTYSFIVGMTITRSQCMSSVRVPAYTKSMSVVLNKPWRPSIATLPANFLNCDNVFRTI